MTVPNAGSSDGGSYHVTVTNTVGSATSEAAEVVVVAAPDILTQPEGGWMVWCWKARLKVSLALPT